MAFNGSGTWNRLYSWGQDKINSVKIMASRMDAEFDGIATGLSTCICKDGQTTITADIPMNNHKLTGLAAASGGTHAMSRDAGDSRYYLASGETRTLATSGLVQAGGVISGVGSTSFYSSVGFASYHFANSASTSSIVSRVDNTTTNLAGFLFGAAGNVGSITTDTASVSYNTTSDRRLKKNIEPLTDVGAIIDALEPVRHGWLKAGAEDITTYGFIAQDLYEVVPSAVKVGGDDANANPWSVDQAKLMAFAIAEIKSLRARVATLEA